LFKTPPANDRCLREGEPPDGALNMLRQYSVDGVIVASSSLHRKLLRACAKAGLPAVQAFGRPGGRMRANVVAADNIQGGRVAADLFCERGYRRVAFLGGPLSATSTEDRLEGFRQRLGRDRLSPVTEVYADSFSYAAGRTFMEALIKKGDIDGVFCGDDILAIGAIDACRACGKSVPEDIGIVGFDDMPMASWTAYNLTTVRQPVVEEPSRCSFAPFRLRGGCPGNAETTQGCARWVSILALRNAQRSPFKCIVLLTLDLTVQIHTS
jgi:DNA-binding LacI/PurR family transcriptional regulator